MNHPIEQFKEWYQEEMSLSKVAIPSACCLSTLGLDGYPNARYLSLKEIIDQQLIITGPLGSRKGQEIQKHPKVALTFWWTYTGRQVRIQGNANTIAEQAAEAYFVKRNFASKVVSTISQQGNLTSDLKKLQEVYQEKSMEYQGMEIPKPANWGGFAIAPTRIEFLVFKQDRFHIRQLFENKNGNWVSYFVEP